MATEKTKLLNKKFYDYRSNASLAVNKKLRECIVVLPSVYHDCDKNNSVDLGLTLEELLPYKDDPWWKCVRRTMMISFWLIVVAILAASCIIAIADSRQQRCTINSTKLAMVAISNADTGGVLRSSGSFLSLSPVNTVVVGAAATAFNSETSTKKYFNLSSIE